MSQVNFVEQFNLFMLYARRNKLTSYERIFYLGLFHCANDLARQTENFEWPDDYFPVSNIELNGWTGFDERAIRNTRNSLKQKGLLNFQKGDGKKSDPMYRIFYLRKNGYKIAPDVPEDEVNGSENAGGQGIGSENAPDEGKGKTPGAKTQPMQEESGAKTQPIEVQEGAITCESAPDPVGDTVGDTVVGHVVTDCENAGEHYNNKLNVNSNVNANPNTPLPENPKEGQDPAPAGAAALEDPELGQVMAFYMDHFAPFPSAIAISGLKDFTAKLTADVVIHAMEIALAERKSSWSYIRGILNRYDREGLNSMVAVMQSEQQYEAGKAAQSARKNREPVREPERPHGGLVDLSGGFGGNSGLVPNLSPRRW